MQGAVLLLRPLPAILQAGSILTVVQLPPSPDRTGEEQFPFSQSFKNFLVQITQFGEGGFQRITRMEPAWRMAQGGLGKTVRPHRGWVQLSTAGQSW